MSSPRGDEKSPCQRSSSGGFCCNLSPQGDGNRNAIITSAPEINCNLSPQGDGNSLPMIATTLSISLQFIPARGQKRTVHAGTVENIGLQLIPARERKPLCGNMHSQNRNCNLSPQGDGNLLQSPSVHHRQQLQFIPVRGQKSTSATGVCQQRRCFAFSYILFYRLGTAPAGIVFVTGSALTPSGTSGFMGRISCR